MADGETVEHGRYCAAIFDLDGVIVDTAKYHYLAWKRLANELGFPLRLPFWAMPKVLPQIGEVA